MARLSKSLGWIVAGLVALVTAFAPATDASGQRLVVRVGEPFEIDGQAYAPAQISLREVRSLTPVTSLYEACVARDCRGMLLARDSKTAAADRDEMIFTRGDQGQLVLVAVAFKGQPTRELSSVAPRASRGSTTATATAAEPVLAVWGR